MLIVEEVLDTWRAAERMLDEVPPVGPDHETVVLAVDAMRATYWRLTTGDARHTPRILLSTRETIDGTRALLATVRAKRHATAAEG